MTDYLALATPGVQKLRPYEPGKPVAELERELGLTDVLKLASNENPLGAGIQAQQAAQAALATLEIYPDGNGFALKEKLAQTHQLTPENITLGNGSNDILELIARAFLTPQSNAVFSAHAFAIYPIVTQAAGAALHMAPATSGYGHDLNAMLALIDDNTKVVFVANPNNPTGTWLTKTDLQKFIAAVPSDVIIVLDEAYIEYVTETEFPNGIQWLAEYANLIVTRTFSKIHGLAALRIGYGLSSPQVADVLNRVRQPFNVNAPALAAALAALDDHQHVQKSCTTNSVGLLQLAEGFTALGLQYLPSVGNFIAVDVQRPCEQVYDAMLRQGVITRPIANYGMPHFIRITIGSKDQNTRVLDALAKALGK